MRIRHAAESSRQGHGRKAPQAFPPAKITAVTALLLFLASLSFWAAENAAPGRQTAPVFLSQGDGGEEEAPERGKVALTFDDGPHPFYTRQLLDGLKERGVKATFFVTGKNAETHPELIRRMSEEGHLIGNHTYSHIQLTPGNREAFRQELMKTSEIVRRITGKDVIYVRPPYGAWDKAFETELNMFPVLWDVDPLDWCSTNAASVAQKVISSTEENSVILMHDCYESTVTAALAAVDELTAQGYSFVTVDEILFD